MAFALASCETGRAVGGPGRGDRSALSPGFPRKEAPVLAGLELTPTATRWDSATSPTEDRRSANREAEAVMGLQSRRRHPRGRLS